MAINNENKNSNAETTTVKKKKTFWQGFLSFLMMGGFLIVLIVGVAIAIGISLLVKC
jgi:hypothetical protein